MKKDQFSHCKTQENLKFSRTMTEKISKIVNFDIKLINFTPKMIRSNSFESSNSKFRMKIVTFSRNTFTANENVEFLNFGSKIAYFIA